MSISVSNFQDISFEIVKDFLQSVVVIDDRAYINQEEQPKAVANKPGRSPLKLSDVEPKHSEKTDAIIPSNKELENLNAKELIDSFAEKGLVCAVIKPEEKGSNDSLIKKTKLAAHRADIIILDWQIGNEQNNGDKAVELIKAIIEFDTISTTPNSSKRLRLIAIYTSNPDTHSIIIKVKKELDIKETQPNNFELKNEALKIVVYQKAGGVKKQHESRVIEEVDLPEYLIKDFANMTQGLLSNVALKSLGALRENTHRILSKFNSNLDAPYIAHRILTNPPEEAEAHPIPLITSEFNDVLEDCNVIDCITPNAIKKWIDTLIQNEVLQDEKVVGMTALEIQTAMIDLLKNGLEIEIKDDKKHSEWLNLLNNLNGAEKDKFSDFTKLLIPNQDDAKDIDADFAILTTLKSGYNTPVPYLKLGSIVKKGSSYFVCIQPLCDSVRLKEKRAFPFLKLNFPATKNPNNFEIVVKSNKKNVFLKIDYKPHNLKLFSFKPGGIEGEIKASKDTDGFFYFTSEDKDGANKTIKYQWVADLKYPHAQRIINEFAYKFSRVGLMESDWLRRMARESKSIN